MVLMLIGSVNCFRLTSDAILYLLVTFAAPLVIYTLSMLVYLPGTCTLLSCAHLALHMFEEFGEIDNYSKMR